MTALVSWSSNGKSSSIIVDMAESCTAHLISIHAPTIHAGCHGGNDFSTTAQPHMYYLYMNGSRVNLYDPEKGPIIVYSVCSNLQLVHAGNFELRQHVQSWVGMIHSHCGGTLRPRAPTKYRTRSGKPASGHWSPRSVSLQTCASLAAASVEGAGLWVGFFGGRIWVIRWANSFV